MTLGDRIYEFNKKYIKKTEEKAKEKTVEDSLVDPPQHQSAKETELSQERRYELATQSALFMKGSIKKNSDTFRAWFSVKQDNNVKVPKEDLDYIRAFERRSQLKKKFKTAGICSDIWGDGFLLIKVYEPDNVGEDRLKRPLPEKALPLDVIVLNPECIYEMYYPDGKDGQVYYHYSNPKKDEDFPIHPDRLLHIKTIDLPHSPFGLSKVDILRNILISNADIDIATGEILKWFSHGTQVLTKQGMQKKERDKALALLKQHPNYFAFSEKYKLEVTNPAAINPTPFYDHITEAISAALIIPRQVLIGIEIGRVTGAEIGYADYYRDIRDNQDLVYTPLIQRLYDLLLAAYDRDFSKYDVSWNTIYIDEMAEADLLGKRVAAAVNAKSGGVVSTEEARKMMNEGHIELDPEDEPEIEQPQQSEMPPKKPQEPDGPQRPEPPERLIKPAKRETQLADYEVEMIEALKRIREEQAAKEKKLGEEILAEQEKIEEKK
jgi:hypothetical protein